MMPIRWLDHMGIEAADRLDRRLPGARPFARFLAAYSPHLFGALFILSWYVAERGDEETRSAIVTSVAAGGIAVGAAKAISKAARRRRPFATIDGISPLVDHRHDSSFPSDHTAGAAAFAAGLVGAPAWLRAPATGLAGVIALSRVYGKLHWPSDVIAGAAVGLAAARVALSLRRAASPLTRFGMRISGVSRPR